MEKVLIIGASGMLGSMMTEVFHNENNIKTFATLRDNKLSSFFPYFNNFLILDIDDRVNENLTQILNKVKPDYIINCAGIIKPYCRDDDPDGIYKAIRINALFPYILDKLVKMYSANTKIIQIATDCVYDGKQGNYTENSLHNPTDVYGKTKSLGEVCSKNFLNLRCSIIGPEIKSKLSLLEWVINQPEGIKINGYTHHYWNGLTTLQFAKFCLDIIVSNSFNKYEQIGNTLHIIKNSSVSKYQLLSIIKEEFKRNITVLPANNIGESINRTLNSVLIPLELSPMESAIKELRYYIGKSSTFSNSLKK